MIFHCTGCFQLPEKPLPPVSQAGRNNPSSLCSAGTARCCQKWYTWGLRSKQGEKTGLAQAAQGKQPPIPPRCWKAGVAHGKFLLPTEKVPVPFCCWVISREKKILKLNLNSTVRKEKSVEKYPLSSHPLEQASCYKAKNIPCPCLCTAADIPLAVLTNCSGLII